MKFVIEAKSVTIEELKIKIDVIPKIDEVSIKTFMELVIVGSKLHPLLLILPKKDSLETPK